MQFGKYAYSCSCWELYEDTTPLVFLLLHSHKQVWKSIMVIELKRDWINRRLKGWCTNFSTPEFMLYSWYFFCHFSFLHRWSWWSSSLEQVLQGECWARCRLCCAVHSYKLQNFTLCVCVYMLTFAFQNENAWLWIDGILDLIKKHLVDLWRDG